MYICIMYYVYKVGATGCYDVRSNVLVTLCGRCSNLRAKECQACFSGIPLTRVKNTDNGPNVAECS